MKNYFLRWKFIAWVQIFDHINNDIFSSSGKNIIVFLYPNLLNANENKFVFKNKEKKFIKIIYLYAEQHNIYIYIYIYWWCTENQKAECSGFQWASGSLKGLKRKKYKIKNDRGEPAKNPPMLKLVFSLKLNSSNFKDSGNLLSFDVNESLYSECWSACLFGNFLNVDES